MDLYPDLVREAVKKPGDRAGLVAVGGWWATLAAARTSAAASTVASIAVAFIGTEVESFVLHGPVGLVREAVKKLGDRATLVAVGGRAGTATATRTSAAASTVASIAVAFIGL